MSVKKIIPITEMGPAEILLMNPFDPKIGMIGALELGHIIKTFGEEVWFEKKKVQQLIFKQLRMRFEKRQLTFPGAPLVPFGDRASMVLSEFMCSPTRTGQIEHLTF